MSPTKRRSTWKKTPSAERVTTGSRVTRARVFSISRTDSTSRPPGLSIWHKESNPSCRSSSWVNSLKTPRQTTPSTGDSGRHDNRSATRNSTSGARSRATSIICGDESIPTTLNPDAARSSACRPVPQPTSTTVRRPANSRATSSGCGAAGLGTTRS
jgi:hypothetical protein